MTKLALHRVDETIHGLKLSIEVPETSRRNAVGDEVLWSFDRGGQPAILLRELGPAGDAATETDALVAGYGEGKKLSRKEVVADGGIAIWADERGFRFARLAHLGGHEVLCDIKQDADGPRQVDVQLDWAKRICSSISLR